MQAFTTGAAGWGHCLPFQDFRVARIATGAALQQRILAHGRYIVVLVGNTATHYASGGIY